MAASRERRRKAERGNENGKTKDSSSPEMAGRRRRQWRGSGGKARWGRIMDVREGYRGA